MLIRELAAQTGVPPKTIRYYETVGLLPPPPRGANNYRHYSGADIDRLRLVAGARRLGIALRDIATILAARAAGEPPCGHVLTIFAEQLVEIDQRLADLLALRTTLAQLAQRGAALPQDDVEGHHCICALVKAYGSHADAAPGREVLP